MHHIRKLELYGFKSFSDRTQIVFNEGVTAIVGPNGCGKSNVADAIGWVVGEQSAKSLRAERMEGVIFNGTQARKATNLAEVVLTLSLGAGYPVPDNLSLDPEEFTVGRRLHRSGESEYFLDGRRCRLKDVQALFEGSGLGPNSYALIEQGRMGQILSSKPADRRSLIEEAARITLFKSRRYSAELKLEMAQQNLLRVHDIVREVARQLNSLRRQAAKARRYSRLREELRTIHKLKHALEGRELRRRTEDCVQRFDAALQREQSILAALAADEEARAACQEECRAEETRVAERRERLSALRLDSGAAQSNREHRQSRRQDLQGRLEDLDREMLAVQERAELAGRERDRVDSARNRLSEEIAGEREILEREQARSDALQLAMAETESAIEGLRSFLLTRAGQLSELRSILARCQESLQRIASQSGRLEEERLGKSRERMALAAQLNDLEAQAGQTSARLADLDRLRREAEKRAAELSTLADQVGAELAARQEEFSIMQHRYSSLEEVERRRSNYSEGVQKYLGAQLPGEDPVAAQTLADLVETDPAYESAVEDYLNSPLQYILVDRLDDAVRSVGRLKRIGAGRCTFMTISNGHVKESPERRPGISGDGVVGFLDGILHMRADVREAFERALPEYASTVVVSDLNTAFRVAETSSGCNFLTLDGEAYSPRGTLSAVGERKSMAGFLSLKREKRDLEDKLGTLRRKIQKSKEELAHIKDEQSGVAETQRSLSSESRDLDIESALLTHQVERLGSELRKMEQTESVAERELSQLQQERQEFEAKLREAERDIREIEERSKSGGAEMQQLAARLDSLRSDNAALARTLAGLTSTHAVKQERLVATEADLSRLCGEIEEICGRLETARNEKASVACTIGELEQEILQSEQRMAECAAQMEATEKELNERLAVLAGLREKLSALEEDLRGLHAEREEAMDGRNRIEIEKTRVESDLDHLERSCRDEFQLGLAAVSAQIEDAGWQRNPEDVAQAFQDLRDRIQNFGAINMRALEEYQELDERHTFLTHQQADIEKSIADTQRAITEINRRSVDQFREAFAAIRTNFIEVFQILFKGGQCDLRLLDEEDVLESGIDIIAQPPGKRLQNILLLSGGEKALTALALLVAIFRYRPSPFCVMDEVDAPLDDANIMRFTQMITELSGQTQFILITHNKRTMEVADTLYGVTMDNPGISQIVSVEFRSKLHALAS